MVQWSRARKRNERQGILAESEAIERAMAESEADSDERANQREREAARRESLDRNYVEAFAQAIREQFPNAPTDGEGSIRSNV